MATSTDQPELPASDPSPAPASETPCEAPSASDTPAAMRVPAVELAPAQGLEQKKRIHSLVVDTGPLIKNDPTIGTLLAQAEELYTIPSVISEIRDEATRNRVQTSLLPFLKIRSPGVESINFVTQFARRTGDLEVLSKPDIHLIALTYELELERNGGDWRLRKTPAKKGMNGSPPAKQEDAPKKQETVVPQVPVANREYGSAPAEEVVAEEPECETEQTLEEEVQKLQINGEMSQSPQDEVEAISAPDEEESEEGGDDDGEGEWITPSNLKKHQAKDKGASPAQPIQRSLQAAILTTDNAMTNVSLRINLNCVNTNFSQVFRLKSWILRCHGCFTVTRKMNAQFCPNCGQATLTRVACSTDSSGNFQIYLKKNYQYNKRGNVYSIPKPVHGSASGKMPAGGGGGSGGWGRNLILTEDQKEYKRKVETDSRARYRDLMDEDYLPGILTGGRSGGHGRIKVGAGRSVNSKKRK